jgi:hypothetical protein
MHRSSSRWLCAAMAAGAAIALSAPLARAGKARGKTLRLFNGKDLTNFYTWLVDTKYQDPDHVFGVEMIDGVPAIRVTGQHYGAFITKQEYSDYHLVAEYSWGHATWGGRKGRTRDSGILLHCQGPDGNTSKDFNGPWMLSQECQIIQGGTGDFILVAGHDKDGNRIVPKLTATVSKDRDGETIYDPKGTSTELQGARINWYGRDPDWEDVLNFRGKNDVETPGNGWTRVEVICDGDKITNLVNGKVVNHGTKSSLTRGKIIFQSEGAEIYFRKIELTPLRR